MDVGDLTLLPGWQLNTLATDMTLKESSVLFVTAGWYRGFILKNPNTKVRDVFGCVHVYTKMCDCIYIYIYRYIRMQSINFTVVSEVQSMSMMDGWTPVSEGVQFTR